MSLRLLLTGVSLFALALTGAEEKNEPVKAGNEAVEARGFAVLGKEAVVAALGIDPGAEVIVIEIEVRPRTDDGVMVSRDDFILISRKDGQRSPGMHPSQIAGPGALRVSSTAQGASGGTLGNRRGPIWGGMPGTGGGRPQRIGGDNDVASVTEAQTKSEIADKKEAEDNPVLAALKKKELVQGKTAEPVKGYLYYIFDGKHKLKDLELMYKTPQGTLMLDFQK
ncbi:MAG: hypothetical protein SGI92_29050 [Bryobacteraceae bacterium]|nr:hypothetical protein [Bryobacteraceae bacterium]